MNRRFYSKKNLTMAFIIIAAFFLLSSNSIAEEAESSTLPVHLNLKEAAKISPETSGDIDRVAIEEKYSSHESNPGAGTPASTRTKGDWKSMGTWESDAVIYDTSIDNVIFNLWWVEDLSDEDYDAALDLQWTVYVDGTEIYQFTDESGQECDEDQGASKDDPCEYLATPDTALSTTLTTGQKISIEVEMKSFQSIYIFYDNLSRDSGMKVVTNAIIFGNTAISGNTVSFEFITSWPANCQEAVDGNFITLIVSGVELDNSQQSSGYPKISEGGSYDINGTQIESEKITWIIDEEYAKLDQSIISFSYSRKTSSTTEPTMINVMENLGPNSVGSSEDDEGLLGLPGFNSILAIFSIIFISFCRREV